MKLPIKKKYFDQIKNGETEVEIRDAHITFICEETGEQLKKKVWASEVVLRHEATDYKKTISQEEANKIFDDEKVIIFELESETNKFKKLRDTIQNKGKVGEKDCQYLGICLPSQCQTFLNKQCKALNK